MNKTRTYSTGSQIITESVESIKKSVAGYYETPVEIPPGLSPKTAKLSSKFSATCVGVTKANGEKCERCRNISLSVGSFLHHPTLCDRCTKTIDDGVIAGLIAVKEDGFYWKDYFPFHEEQYLPMSDHVDYWCEKYGEQWRTALECAK